MIRLRFFIIILILYCISVISINYDINILYPYYFIKDLILYPVRAMASTNDLIISNEFKEERISNLEEEIKELKKITEVDNILTEFNNINATVIERNREYWFNSLTINLDLISDEFIKENNDDTSNQDNSSNNNNI